MLHLLTTHKECHGALWTLWGPVNCSPVHPAQCFAHPACSTDMHWWDEDNLLQWDTKHRLKPRQPRSPESTFSETLHMTWPGVSSLCGSEMKPDILIDSKTIGSPSDTHRWGLLDSSSDTKRWSHPPKSANIWLVREVGLEQVPVSCHHSKQVLDPAPRIWLRPSDFYGWIITTERWAHGGS